MSDPENTSQASAENERIPTMQKLLDNPFLLLFHQFFPVLFELVYFLIQIIDNGRPDIRFRLLTAGELSFSPVQLIVVYQLFDGSQAASESDSPLRVNHIFGFLK